MLVGVAEVRGAERIAPAGARAAPCLPVAGEAGLTATGLLAGHSAEVRRVSAVSKGLLEELQGLHSTGQAVHSVDPGEIVDVAADHAHAACFVCDPFPSAAKCGQCHPRHYREWSVSSHAYAQLSPVFNAMSNRLIAMNNGTLGDFCIRCHTPVGMALEEPIDMTNIDRHPTSREGVTCVVCHRINQAWGKSAARQALVPGGIHQAVYGPTGNATLQRVLNDPEQFGVLKTRCDDSRHGRDIHANAERFFQITTPAFCGACHDVFAPNGFRLEDAFSEYKQSPAARELGVSCQDCHMGKVPGEPLGYDVAPAAFVGNAATPPRKHTNHMIVGPDYSIVHAGVFPHNPRAVREECADPLDEGFATIREWLSFDDEAGWGTDAFERSGAADAVFQEPWADAVRRRKAREILNEQHQLLDTATRGRLHLLRVGYRLCPIGNVQIDRGKISFETGIANGTTGHGVPTGFDAERLVFLRVTVWDRDGRPVFQSGDLDPNGDVRDSHSAYVHAGRLPLDRQLTKLQTPFIVRNIRGGEREQILNVPFTLDPLPYTRPETRAFTILGRPLAARKHKHNVEVGGVRRAEYVIDRGQLTGCGPYTVRVQLIAGMVPVNLVHAISPAGFDYCLSPAEVARRVVQGHLVIHEQTCRLNVDCP